MLLPRILTITLDSSFSPYVIPLYPHPHPSFLCCSLTGSHPHHHPPSLCCSLIPSPTPSLLVLLPHTLTLTLYYHKSRQQYLGTLCTHFFPQPLCMHASPNFPPFSFSLSYSLSVPITAALTLSCLATALHLLNHLYPLVTAASRSIKDTQGTKDLPVGSDEIRIVDW